MMGFSREGVEWKQRRGKAIKNGVGGGGEREKEWRFQLIPNSLVITHSIPPNIRLLLAESHLNNPPLLAKFLPNAPLWLVQRALMGAADWSDKWRVNGVVLRSLCYTQRVERVYSRDFIYIHTNKCTIHTYTHTSTQNTLNCEPRLGMLSHQERKQTLLTPLHLPLSLSLSCSLSKPKILECNGLYKA